MTLRAIAFHESISAEKMDAVFKSDTAQVFAGFGTIACAKCGAKFAVYFPANDDTDNKSYTRSLEVEIADDCDRGKHNKKEIRFTTTP